MCVRGAVNERQFVTRLRHAQVRFAGCRTHLAFRRRRMLAPLSQIRPRGLAVIFIVGFTIWGYASIGPNGRLEPGRTDQHRTDFTVFTEAGAAFFDGRNAYGVASPRGWHYLYPPLFALLVAPLAVFDTESQVVCWYAVSVVLTFGCFGEARRLWRLCAGSERRGSLARSVRVPRGDSAVPRLHAGRPVGDRDPLPAHVGLPAGSRGQILGDLVSRRSDPVAAREYQARALLARRVSSLAAVAGGCVRPTQGQAVGSG